MQTSPGKRACPLAWLGQRLRALSDFWGVRAGYGSTDSRASVQTPAQMNSSKGRRAGLLSLHAVLVIHANGSVRDFGKMENSKHAFCS
jgi:hypothetical protein